MHTLLFAQFQDVHQCLTINTRRLTYFLAMLM